MTRDRPGYRNNGTGFTATTDGKGRVRVKIDIDARGGRSYYDYDVALKVHETGHNRVQAEGKKEKTLSLTMPQKARYKQRSSVERVNSRLKDEFGGRSIWVKGNLKIMTHLMFGMLALTADQLMKYVI